MIIDNVQKTWENLEKAYVGCQGKMTRKEFLIKALGLDLESGEIKIKAFLMKEMAENCNTTHPEQYEKMFCIFDKVAKALQSYAGEIDDLTDFFKSVMTNEDVDNSNVDFNILATATPATLYDLLSSNTLSATTIFDRNTNSVKTLLTGLTSAYAILDQAQIYDFFQSFQVGRASSFEQRVYAYLHKRITTLTCPNSVYLINRDVVKILGENSKFELMGLVSEIENIEILDEYKASTVHGEYVIVSNVHLTSRLYLDRDYSIVIV